jgi:acetyltransferase-like isoleucine patch superfamily enzyme
MRFHIKRIIESNVWIGAGAIVVPGIAIGVDAIIGAGAVVIHDAAARQVVAGVPADLLGERSLSSLKQRNSLP